MDGILIVNKPVGMTSRDVVNIVSKILYTKKIGHTGTLDPLASGVLVLCIGNATQLVEIITSQQKEYIAQMILGLSSDTLDITGTIDKEEQINIEESKLFPIFQQKIGTYQQQVPIYSAVKINGKKLYEYARENTPISLPSREITIYSLDIISPMTIENNHQVITFKTTVSKGTYIRSLIKDLAQDMGTIAIMKSLKRTKQGNYTIENSYTLEDIEKGNYKILPIESCLQIFYKVTVTQEIENKIKNGQILENIYQQSPILFENEQGIPLALYQTYSKDIHKIKPWKMFTKNKE